MTVNKVLAIVVAGVEGSRLHPLTAERSKPAVPFWGRYRLVDFVLSDLVNSGVHAIYVLVQYKSRSLVEHINRAWLLPPVLPGQFVKVVPPQMRKGPGWFQGIADAVYWRDVGTIARTLPPNRTYSGPSCGSTCSIRVRPPTPAPIRGRPPGYLAACSRTAAWVRAH